MKKISYLFICLFLGLCLTGCKDHKVTKNPKIEIVSDNIEGDAWNGIEVFIICDYSKHPKYDEWIKKYNLKYDYSEGTTKFEDDYYGSLNGACYELVKDDFKTGKFSLMGVGEWLYFTYPSWKELYFDYHSIDLISKEDYVEMVVIHLCGEWKDE